MPFDTFSGSENIQQATMLTWNIRSTLWVTKFIDNQNDHRGINEQNTQWKRDEGKIKCQLYFLSK